MLRLTGIAIIVLLATATGSAPMAATGLLAQHCAMATCFPLESTIAFSSTRESSTAEVYLMKPDGTDARRLTTDNAWGDGFASLSPEGKQIVFDSARLSGAVNDTDLFVMEGDGSGQLFLARGSSATWSPDSRYIAFHASVSGTGTPIRDDPGSATSDSDVFVANVDDLLAGWSSRGTSQTARARSTTTPIGRPTASGWSSRGTPWTTRITTTRPPPRSMR